MDPNNMLPWNKPRTFRSPGEEDVATSSKTQQRARPRLARSQRRRCRQTTSEQQEDQARPLQVYKFRSRAPPTSLHSNGEGSLGFSRIPALMEGGNIVEMLAKTASYLMQQDPPRCWVRDCTGLACSATGHPRRHLLRHHLPGFEDRLTSLIREALLSVDEGNDSSTEDTETVSTQADTTSDDTPRSLAEEYSLAPLNTRKRDSAQSFDQQVENYFNQP